MFKLLKCSLSSQSLIKCYKSPNRNFSILARSSQHTLNVQERDKRSKNIFGVNVEPRRNFFLESLQEFNNSINRYVTTSEVSLYVKSSLIEFHDITGFSWWSSIILAAAITKLTVTLIPAIFQQHIMAKVNLTNLEVEKIFKEKIIPEVHLQAQRGLWPPAKVNSRLFIEKKKVWKILMVKNNCHPFKIFILSFIQFPVWVTFSCTLRDLANEESATVPPLTKVELQSEGVWWNTNLTLPDDTLIIPTILFLTSLALIEINSLSSASITVLSKFFTLFLRFFSILTFFIGINTSLCLSLYWTTSLFVGLCINLLLMAPKIRRLFMIPLTPREIPNPYRNLKVKFTEKLFWVFGKKT